MTPTIEVAPRRVRLVAHVLWRALLAVAALHAYWMLGGTWAVHAGSGGQYSDATTGLRILSGVMVVVVLVACLVVRARAGLWRAPVSAHAVHVAAWVLTAALSLAAVVNFAGNTNWERFLIAPLVLALAALSFVVAGSGRTWHVRRPHPPSPQH